VQGRFFSEVGSAEKPLLFNIDGKRQLHILSRNTFRCENLQKPRNAGSRPQVQFFNTLIESVHRNLPDSAGFGKHFKII